MHSPIGRVVLPRIVLPVLPALAAILFPCLPARAADKSGVSPTSISLPSGPGSIEGLGAEFQPQLNTGTGSYSVPLSLPPTPGGRSVELSLDYQGGNGNSPLGIGWSLPIPSIRRQCEKGIPGYDPNGEDDDFDGLTDEEDEGDRFLDFTGEELVLTSGGIYFPEKQEQFIRYRHIEDAGDDYWEARYPDGTVLECGRSPAARVSEGDRIGQWLAERRIDPNGNVLEYRYQEFPGSTYQKYLEEMRYGPGSPPWSTFYLVFFTYEDRLDVMEDYRIGFLLQAGKRLARIDVAIQGVLPPGHQAGDVNADGTADALIRRYELAYEAHSHWSLLTRVTVVGADGVSTLPPARFGYGLRDLPRVVSAAETVIGSRNEPVRVMDNAYVDLIDLNADGLPDILKTELGGSHTAYLNEGVRSDAYGEVIQWSTVREVDAGASGGLAWQRDLSSDEVSLVDVDGDGLADLIFNPSQDPNPRYYRNQGTVAWGPQEMMSVQDTVPPAPFGDADVRTLDINFDKRMDIVKSIPNGYQVWYTLGKRVSQGAQYSRAVLTPGALHQDTVIQFSDPGVQLADLNGDRLTDVARIRPAQVIFCPSRGYGEFAESVVIPIPPDSGFGHDSGFSYLTEGPGEQIERASLRDITGDGLDDLVVERAAYRELWFWVNLGNRTFSQRYIVTDLPGNFTTLNPSVRWADLNGNGTADLVYADSGLGESERLRVVDVGLLVNGSPCPNLVTRIENGIGKEIVIEYRPSTAFAVDDLLAGNPWTNPMPNPANLVSRITVYDGLGNDYVNEFHYHDGYYDGVEKEFRGFGQAEQVALGDASQPTLVTEHAFDVGRTDEFLKGKTLRTVSRMEDGKVFSEQQNTWVVRRLFTVTPEPEDPLAATGVSYPYLSLQRQILREEPGGGTEPVVIEKEYACDDYGNLVMKADYGRVVGSDRNAGDDERIIWRIYSATPEAPVWNRMVRSVLTDNALPPKVVSDAQYFYDGTPFNGLPSGQATAGNLVRIHSWVGPQNPAQPPQPLAVPAGRFLAVSHREDGTLALAITDGSGMAVDPAADHWIDQQRNRYDAYGNMTITADPLARIVAGSPDPSLGHYREIAFDSDLHTYVVGETVYAGEGRSLQMQVHNDLGFGVITEAWDFNGHLTRMAFDEFSRLVSIVKPGGQPPDTPEMPTQAFEYRLTVPVAIPGGSGVVNWIETRFHERCGDPGAYYVARTFMDGLGRTVMSKEEDEQSGQTIVKQATLYNERLQSFRVLLPFYSSKGLDFEDIHAPGWSGTWIVDGEAQGFTLGEAPANEMYYDALGRGTKTVQADGAFSRTEHLPLVRKIFDEEDTNAGSPYFDTPTVLLTDGLDRLVQVEERVRLNDDGTPRASPATWRTTYAYDLLDNITRITDSQGNVKRLAYDGIKRKVYMDDPDRGRMWYTYDDASNLSETVDAKGQRVTYTYDGVNRLRTEDFHDEGLPGSYNRVYNPSLPLSEINRPDVLYLYDLPATLEPSGDIRSRQARNTVGLLASIIDLSGEEHISYDERGRPAWVIKRIPDPRNGFPVSYWTGMEYDAYDRVTRRIFPDGDAVSYEYNSRTLLERILGGETSDVGGAHPLVSAIDYVPSGFPMRIEYGNGVVTQYDYDRRIRLSATRAAKGSEPASPFLHYSYLFDGVSNINRLEDLRPASQLPAGAPRRNTQILEYDDLYRLTGITYSFAPPGDSDRNDGRIDYRYDRVGNMLWKSSPEGEGHLERVAGEFSVVNLGQLDYGGGSGAWGRVGRTPADPPGPHALTATGSGQAYSYDANGNVTELAGLRCTWDFKDRLVRVETDTMRAEYTYDYSGRRIAKKVWEMASPPSVPGASFALFPSTTTVYVNQHFEVRDFDQPVKYLWNGSSRVARVIGALSPAAERLQWVRVFEGWNLLSLAVESASSALQIATQLGTGTGPSDVVAYRCDDPSGIYQAVMTSDPLPAGCPFWLESAVGTVLLIQGAYRAPADSPLSAGANFVSSAGLEALGFDEALPSDPVEVWIYDAQSGLWRCRLPGEEASLSSFPACLAPGQAAYVRTASAGVKFQAPDPALRIRYYHADHLGSIQTITDASGELGSETLFFPFGSPRHEYRAATVRSGPEHRFGGKEQDQESGLQYFEARYYANPLGRFLSVDSFYGNPDTLPKAQAVAFLSNPQYGNPYAYGLNAPHKYADPSGLEVVTEQIGGMTLHGEQADVDTWKRWLAEEMSSPAFQKKVSEIVLDEDNPVTLNVGRNNAAFIDSFSTGNVDLEDLEQFDTNPRYPLEPTRGELMLHVLAEYHHGTKLQRINTHLPPTSVAIYQPSHNEALKEGGAQHQYRQDRGLPGRMTMTSGEGKSVSDSYAYFHYKLGEKTGMSMMTRVVNGQVARKEHLTRRYDFVTHTSQGAGLETLGLQGIGD